MVGSDGIKGKYLFPCSMTTAVLTGFHGPAGELPFSVLDARSSTIFPSLYSAIQTVKYAVCASKKSTVECFRRIDSKYTLVNHELCCLTRSASSARRAEQKKRHQDEYGSTARRIIHYQANNAWQAKRQAFWKLKLTNAVNTCLSETASY